VKIGGVFGTYHQAVHELVGKIIDSNPPSVSIDLAASEQMPSSCEK